MGSYLSEPVVEKQSSNEANDKLTCGSSSMQGWRVTQEDAHNCILDFDKNTALFAVYDGHGGHEVALYCSQKLPEYIKNTEAYKNGDLEKALIEGFLGFDATIAAREVVAELQLLVGKNKESVDSDCSDLEDNVSNLCEEASMPLEKVIEKYTSNLKNPSLLNVQKDGEKLPGSPYLRARKDGSSSLGAGSSGISKTEIKEDEVVVQEGSASNSKESKANGSPSGEPEPKKEETKEEVVAEKTASEVKPTLNGESDHAPEKESKENGQVSKKGKAIMKTKGVIDQSNLKQTRPRRSAQQLYDKLLDLGSESESEDENDKTFQGPHEESTTDDEEENNAHCADDEEEDIEEEEEEEEEDEDDLDEEEDECEMDFEFAKNMREEPGSDSGCTAVVALLQGNMLYVANAGDSRCIVCRNGEAVEMSIDHKPEDDLERNRIIKAGGKVSSDGRVNGGLNLSRAIGDHAYKQNNELTDREQMITALPDVRTLTINPSEDEFMVLACDGIWNFMSSQEVVDFIKPKLAENADKFSHICEELFDHCLAPNTLGDGTGCDNMTAMIIGFKNTLSKRPASDEEEESCSKKKKVSETEEKTIST